MRKTIFTTMVYVGFILTVLLLPTSVKGSNLWNNEKEHRIIQLAEYQINLLANNEEYNGTLVPSRIKEAYDFLGNLYYVIEFNPSGYMILNDSSGVIVETAVSSPSPYLRYEDEIFYGGPCSYVVEDRSIGQYVDVVTGACFDNLPDSNSSASLRCVALQEELEENQNEGNLSFLSGEISFSELFGDSLNELVIENPGGGTGSTFTYVPYRTYISGLNTATQMGYAYDSTNSEGMCGWVASGIVILWHQNYSGLNLIATNNVYAHKFTSNAFTWLLRSFGNNSDTNGTDLKNAINAYATSYSKTISATLGWTTVSAIINQINLDRPIICGGFLWNPQANNGSTVSHYVVIYGYSDDYFVCHYGWEYYPQVYLSRALTTIWGDCVKMVRTAPAN